jgi:hypothetical protein
MHMLRSALTLTYTTLNYRAEDANARAIAPILAVLLANLITIANGTARASDACPRCN